MGVEAAGLRLESAEVVVQVGVEDSGEMLGGAGVGVGVEIVSVGAE